VEVGRLLPQADKNVGKFFGLDRYLTVWGSVFKVQKSRYYMVFTATENREGVDFYRQNGLVPLYTTLIGEI
jgi:hypothetical protein